MKAFGLARIGRDAEIRYTQGSDAVASLSLAFSYGRKGDDGKRPTQWVDASLWGKRAEALAPYLKKGGLVSVSLEDVHTEVYQGRSGEATKVVARVVDIELAGSSERQQPAPAPAPARQQQQRPTQPQHPAPAPQSSGFDDMDNDIPF
ncbi:MAG: single-stranded DNA-binding protein [Macromonas sp.]